MGESSLLSGTISEEKQGFDEEKLRKAYRLIQSNYVRDVTDQKLMDGAIQGMVKALEDPYSAYMDPKQANQFKSDLKSSFTGIGAEVTMRNGRLTIVSPFKDSPAAKAGVRPEDQVIKVNDKSLEGLDINAAVSHIRGPKGTKAELEIVRPGVQDILKITVIRDEIPIHTVETKMLADQIGLITITQFSEKTADEFESGIAELEKQGIKGLVIDVRGNPGGLLPTVLQMSDALIAKDKMVLITEDKQGKRQEFKSNGSATKSYPINVLINKGSASASEILAAVLKESGGYQLVGETTFGKGTVQSAEEFTDGSNMKITIAKWLTPTGKWIDQNGGSKGIKPDVEVKAPDYYQAFPPYPEKPLKKNDNSVEVKNMQMVLDALGYKPGRTDGYFDDRTDLAVKAFQKTKDITANGQFDTKTAEQLRESFTAFLQDPKQDVQLQVAAELLKKQIK
nr:S41 family peptidase [Polycladospora coralii]